MGRWLTELKGNLGEDVILHVVGTKSDVVAEEPGKREVPFERCIAYVAENMFNGQSGGNAGAGGGGKPASVSKGGAMNGHATDGAAGISSNRSSGFWGQELGWDCCHEVSAKDGEGVEEVFRVITRKLVEQRNRRIEREMAMSAGYPTPGFDGGAAGYFDDRSGDGGGSFRVGVGDKRRSWLGGLTTPGIGGLGGGGSSGGDYSSGAVEVAQWESGRRKRGGRCC